MEIKQTKDICVDKLTSTYGADLEITANLQTSPQVKAVLQCYAGACLGSAFARDQYEILLRLTDSWKGRARDDLTSIGKSTPIESWNQSMGDGDDSRNRGNRQHEGHPHR